jgi:TetR/AcrR family transcriptional repressor of uid operon
VVTDDLLDPISERILAGALSCFQEVGIQRTTMDDIARAAGVSRITVFRRFDTKDQLVAIVVLRVMVEVNTLIRAAFLAEKNLERALTAALMASLRALRDHPLFAKVVRTEPESLVQSLSTDGATVIALVRNSVSEWLGTSGGGPLSDEDAEFVAETLTRLGISLILTPNGVIPIDDDKQMQAYLARYVVPGIALLAKP